MMQHDQQESRETMPRPRFIHEDLLHLGTITRVLQAAGHAPDEILRTVLAKIDGLERKWRTKLDASLTAMAEAVNDPGGWVGELTTDQWEQVAAAIDAAWKPTEPLSSKPRQYASLKDFTAEVRRNLEQQEGYNPS